MFRAGQKGGGAGRETGPQPVGQVSERGGWGKGLSDGGVTPFCLIRKCASTLNLKVRSDSSRRVCLSGPQ